MSREKQNKSHRKRHQTPVDKSEDKKPRLDEVWPVHSAGGWPQGLSLDRGDIYEGRA